MFQNSLINRLPLRCPEHPKNQITHFCTQPKCEAFPLLCEQCRASYRYKQRHCDHELQVMQLQEGISQMCERLQGDKKAVSRIYGEMVGVKGAEGLLKWQEEKEQHFSSIEKHIGTIKFQIQEEINNIVFKFQEELRTERDKMYMKLQNYYKHYRQKFDKFSKLTQPIVALHNKYQFYANTSALFFKISTQLANSSLTEWLNQFKHTLSLSQKATAFPGDYIEQIRKYGQAANDIMDDLPRIRNEQYQKQMPVILNLSAKDVLRSLVTLKESRGSNIARSTSLDSLSADIGKYKHSAYN